MNLFEERPLFVYCIGPLLVFFALTFVISDLEAYLSLVTANTLITHTYVWNLVTCSFYESNIFKVGVDIAWLWILSGWIGQPNVEQFGLYFIFTLLACSLGASILCFLQFSLLKSEIPLLTPMYGFNGVIMAMLMYTRQMFKQQAITPRYPTITFHHLPIVYFTIQLVLYVINFTWFTQDIVFTMIGMLFSWSYLRFYYKFQELESTNSNNSQFGDKSEDFTFVHMFPEPVHIVLIPFTTAFYNILVLLSIFPALETMEIKRQSHHLRFVCLFLFCLN